MTSPFLPDRKLWSVSIADKVWMTDRVSVLSPLAVDVDPWAPRLKAHFDELVCVLDQPLRTFGYADPAGADILISSGSVVIAVPTVPWSALIPRGLVPRLAVAAADEGHRHVISWWAEDSLAGVTTLKVPT